MDVRTLTDVLELLQNGEAYSKKVAELKQEQENLIKIIEAVGSVDEIEKILLSTKKDKELSSALLETSQKEAERILTQAKKSADELKQEAMNKLSEAQRQLNVAQTKEAQAEESVRIAQQQAEEAKENVAQSRQMRKNVEQLELEVKERLAKLKSVMV